MSQGMGNTESGMRNGMRNSEFLIPDSIPDSIFPLPTSRMHP